MGVLTAIQKAAKAAKETEEDSPLAQAIAARMIGQLNAVSQLPGLEALSKVNLPAAYAGDQRSALAARRAINEAETGIASPSRRKILKQGVATAARAAIPEGVTGAALRAIAKPLVEHAATEIPEESLRNAVSSAFMHHMEPFLKKGYTMDDLLWARAYATNGDYALWKEIAEDYPHPKQWRTFNLTPKMISSYSGLPEEHIKGFIGKHISPDANILDYLADMSSSTKYYFEEPRDIRDILVDLPLAPDPESYAWAQRHSVAIDAPENINKIYATELLNAARRKALSPAPILNSETIREAFPHLQDLHEAIEEFGYAYGVPDDFYEAAVKLIPE